MPLLAQAYFIRIFARARSSELAIADIHRLWCSKGVYRKAFEEIRNENIDLENNYTEAVIYYKMAIDKRNSNAISSFAFYCENIEKN